MRNAEQYALQTYYDSVIAEAKKNGFRFVSQVQITTDDLPYYIYVDSARSTILVFDIPDKAVFIRLYHHEYTDFFEQQGYQNHWRVELDLYYGSHQSLIDRYIERNKTFDAEGFTVLKKDLFSEFKLDNRYSATMCGSEGQFTFQFELSASEKEKWNDPTAEQIVDLAKQALGTRTDYVVAKFDELMMLWEPLYVFGGRHPSLPGQQRQACSSLYWERFGDARAVIRMKIKKMY
jgi:hypothetical protein